jgi:uncharacterized protein YfiM (DUF2279 family)
MIQQDKLFHALAGLIIVLLVAQFTNLLNAFMVAMVVGAAKEFWDWFHPETNTADWRDFLASAAGAVSGVVIWRVM